jgi:mono/diheme cytochrome c family protein
MYRKFYLWVSLLSGITLFLITLYVGYEEIFPEWKTYQVEYRNLLVEKAGDAAAKERAKALDIRLQQIYLGDMGGVDRCTNCHLGVENPTMKDAKPPFKLHSGDYVKNHPPDRFGCTVCHNGQGRAIERNEAHGIGKDTHWDRPIIPFEYIQSSCASCHDFEMLKDQGGKKVVEGEILFREKGCMGCHKLSGVGGVLGKSLDGVGSQPVAYFPMRYVEGEKTIYAWMKEHFDDPRNIVQDSQMIPNLGEEESDLLTTFVLSLRTEEMPKKYRRISGTPFPRKAADNGEALYKMYCIACHTTGKESVFDPVFQRSIPAIMNTAFLKVADDKVVKTIVEEGRANTQMTAWKEAAAGLKEEEIKRIIEYVGRERPQEKSEPFPFSSFEGNRNHGREIYEIRCTSCHGTNGEGGVGLNLRNPVVQKELAPEFLAVTVRDGREGTPMAAFGKKGVGLSNQDIVDVVTYIRTLASKK